MDTEASVVKGVLVVWGLRVAAAVAIFFVGRIAARLLSRLTERMLVKAKVDVTLAQFAKHIVQALIMLFVVIAAIGQLGVQTTSLVAIVGAAGLAIGLALQGSLANFAAGIMIIMFKPFRCGDFIEAAGTMGTVKEIHIFNTILAHPDNRKIIVPNGQVTGGNITNFSDIERRRVDLTYGISYDDDMKKAKEVLMALIEQDPRILKDPAPVVAVSALGDSSVNLICRPWVKPADYWAVNWDLTEKGKEALEAAGMTIPYPQRDVHLYNEKS